jgi:redox-sensitive bicupin YhaK (pirin superfamily)
MEATRKIRQIFKSRPTIEGAGVHLRRAFGANEVPLFDPFLLFDDFRSAEKEHFIKGFPWHPHRGIETITYVLSGDVEHGDNIMISTAEEPLRFLLIAGKPLAEPVAWQGPIVMNTQAELQLAFAEYHNGTFIKH